MNSMPDTSAHAGRRFEKDKKNSMRDVVIYKGQHFVYIVVFTEGEGTEVSLQSQLASEIFQRVCNCATS
jgi:hypothetical protein